MSIYGSFSPQKGQTLGVVTLSGFEMQILQLDWDGIKRDPIDVTNMNVQPTSSSSAFGNKIFLPSCYVDPGELSLTILHDPTQRFPIADPNDDGPVDITIKLGPANSVQETFAALGFMTEYKINGPLDGTACTANVKIKLTDTVDNTYDALGAVELTLAS